MNTQIESKILPLDLNSIKPLLACDNDTFKPLNYSLEDINDNEIRISLDSHYLDPESIQLQITDNYIQLNGKMILNLSYHNQLSPIELTRNFETSIPLPTGIKIDSIYTDVNSDKISFYLTI